MVEDTVIVEFKSEPAPADGDNNGGPDARETANGLNPANGKDKGDYTGINNHLRIR